MKTIVHVHQAVIRANRKTGANDPPLISRTYKGVKHAHCLEIVDKEGRVIGRFLHSPFKPLSCGARVWFETEYEVRQVSYDKSQEKSCKPVIGRKRQA